MRMNDQCTVGPLSSGRTASTVNASRADWKGRHQWTRAHGGDLRLTVLMRDDDRLVLKELRRALDVRAYMEVFESLPHAVVVVGGTGHVAAHNPAARDLFGARLDDPALRCCDLVGCGRDGDQQPLGYRCITAAVADLGGPLDGVDFVLDGRYVEVTAVPLRAGGGAVLHFEATARAAMWCPSGRFLRITALGPLRLEYLDVSLGGEWLDHRPGQLLKYLICSRGRRVAVEELAETLWGNCGRAGLTSLRQAVHGLRDRLEPERPKHAPSRFVLARANAYELDTTSIVIDADEFERQAAAALLAVERSTGEKAQAQLARVAGIYRAEFLADEPYAEWALAERDRLRDLATRVLRALAETHLAQGQLADACGALQRLAELEPLDLDAQRDLIALLLRQRRHADAARRYELARRQFKRAFGREPDFTLADLAKPAAIAA
jgi:DNA-binding SARP family transcriptional activator